MPDDTDPVAIKRRRATVKASCTRIKNYIESIKKITPEVISQVEERKLKLDEYWFEYDKVQGQLELIDDTENDDRASFEEAFFSLSSRIRGILKPPAATNHGAAASPTPSNSNHSNTQSSSLNVRLPKLDLPKFSGKYDEWFPFRDAFKSVIHSNSSLSNIHKLQYLRAATIDEASKLIGSLELSDANYETAWNLLKDRYDNKRAIVQNHIKAIIKLPTMTKENASELRQIADGAVRHIQALKALKRPTDTWDDLLVYLLASKLDHTTSREWQMSLEGHDLPTLKQFINFLTHHCQVLETTIRTSKDNTKNINSRLPVNKQKSVCNAVVKTKCYICSGEHAIYQCQQFLALAINQRIKSARSHKICLNCLRSTSHVASKCPSGSCKICSRKHNTLLHLSNSTTEHNKNVSVSKSESNSQASSDANTSSAVVAYSASTVESKEVLLATAIVLAHGEHGSQRPCRVLLDPGSQANFITKDFLNSLNLSPRKVNISIAGINNTVSHSSQAIQIKLSSRVNSVSIYLDCIVTDQITDNLPSFTLNRSEFEIPRNICLADPKFNISSKIDVLIGADIFWDLLCVGQIKASNKHPTLQKTKLGWIIAGRLYDSHSQISRVSSLHASISNVEIHKQLNKLWELDSIQHNSNNYTLEEINCEKHFVENTSRDPQGRYVVKLPLKEDVIHKLGNSRDHALKRLKNLEKRFHRNSTLKDQYSAFMSEYIRLGHMKPVIEESTTDSIGYYLPHHCVLKEDAKTTKLRVVFDGSCKTDSGISLNDSMMVGPVVQEDLFSILVRFRTFKYVLVGDIIKMYRQILVHPSQTRYQRILWRSDENSEYQAFELTTVTYGTSSASYLATRCLKDLAEQHAIEYPAGSAHVKRDFYVDDLLTGADSKSEVIMIRDQIVQLLKLGCFELSKWGSNLPELLEDSNDSSTKLIPFDKQAEFRLLGILWDRDSDIFQFSYKPPLTPDSLTKRVLLSEILRFFDPLGLIGPSTVLAKLLLQELWQLGTDWDESIPQDIHTKWLQLKLQLSSLNKLQIPRRIKYNTDWKLIQIHGFCDASQRAYGACVYIRSQVDSNTYQSHLLCSKSRVAPLKAVSLPRLELSGALLLAQLIDKIKSSFQLIDVQTFLWSDSTIALSWISSPSKKWSVFVANRVGEIQRLTNIASWKHISSPENPADLISRGLLPEDLINSTLWWHGPEYLGLPDSEWPCGEFSNIKDDIPEQKFTCTIIHFKSTVVNELLNKFSSLNKTCRIIAYCIRFLRAQKIKVHTRRISTEENLDALKTICKAVQRQEFANEYSSLQVDGKVSNTSNLISLSPFMGDDELIRVGGRLKNSALHFDASHQVVLPKNHVLTKRIIAAEHIRNMHAGTLATMAAVRQRFWPLALRSTTRSVISHCIICFRAKPITSEAVMGSLPTPRVTVSRPFSHCGVDYAGPVTLREGKRRNSRNRKAYIAIFVCFATKAVHIELVSDLTTEAFLAALKRLISRRGKPIKMYSDNATTFLGAQRQLKELYEFVNSKEVIDSVELFLSEHNTSWSFIPPNAPNFGGLWEAAVKSAKFHLTRIVGGAHLTFEEMQTILCEIEAILNSRPLVPLSSDPNDTTYLSPGHFLVGSPLNSFPTLDLNDVNTNRLLRWQVIEQMRQHFWSRWSSEYLNHLQERNKWKTCKGQQLEPGKLVLIKQQGLAPLQWLIGRIEQVHPGTDGIVRSATIKTKKGSYVRPISKLALMPT